MLPDAEKQMEIEWENTQLEQAASEVRVSGRSFFLFRLPPSSTNESRVLKKPRIKSITVQ
jgi:hypothetical protein